MKHKTVGPCEKFTNAPVKPRKFHSLGAAVALLSTLTFAGMNFVGTKSAKADTVEVDKVKVEVSKVNDTLANLDKKTAATYVREDGVVTTGDYVSSANRLNAQGVSELTFGVGWKKDGTGKVMNVHFPAYLDQNPSRKGAGTWGMDLDEFASIVKKTTSQDLTRVKIVIENSIDEKTGERVINAFALPVDANGNIIGKYQNGYLAAGISFYPDVGGAGGGTTLIYEPNVHGPFARK